MPVTITIGQLRAAGACEPALDKLRVTYGERRTFADPPALAEALLASEEAAWFAGHMLRAPIWAKYKRQHADMVVPIWAEYERENASIRAECVRQCASILAGLVALIWTGYERQHAPIRAKYKRQRADLAARLYFEQEKVHV